MVGPVPQEGTEEKGDYTCRDPPWGVSSSRHIYGATVLVSSTEEEPSCLVGGPVGLTRGPWEAYALPRSNVHVCESSQIRGETVD